MKKLDILVVGVGGQGVILASDIIGETALSAQYDAKKADTLGMAQRGGSVISHVRIGQQIYSPLIKKGEVDILIALEKLEAARWGYYLKPGGVTIVNNHAVPPSSVNTGNERYPNDQEITSILKQRTDRICFINGTRHAGELGNVRTLNIFMLGSASVFMPFETQVWEDTISQHLSPNIRQINIAAFRKGRKEMRNDHLG